RAARLGAHTLEAAVEHGALLVEAARADALSLDAACIRAFAGVVAVALAALAFDAERRLRRRALGSALAAGRLLDAELLDTRLAALAQAAVCVAEDRVGRAVLLVHVAHLVALEARTAVGALGAL